MAEDLPKKGPSLLLKAFLILFAGMFAIIGVGAGLRNLLFDTGTSTEAASVGDTKIGLAQFDRDFRNRLREAQTQLGPDFTPTPAQKQLLARAALEQDVAEALYANAA